MDVPLNFVAGLPRSGSTLLMNLLGQNPAHHVTPTSGLIELFVMVKNRWPEFIEFKSEGLEVIKPRVLGALRGLLNGFFEPEFTAGKVVFDKSRGWLQYIEPLEEALGRRVQIIVTVRDIRAIVASFEKLYRRRSIEYREPLGDTFFQCQTIEGRADVLLNDRSVLGLTIARLRDTLARGLGDRLIIVPYRAFTTCPCETLALLHTAIGSPQFVYDPNNVRQLTNEDDHYHGMPLHKIRPTIEPPKEEPWEGILPVQLCRRLASEYEDINQLANWRFIEQARLPRSLAQEHSKVQSVSTSKSRRRDRLGRVPEESAVGQAACPSQIDVETPIICAANGD